jgi:hypothetical protein
LHSVHAERRTLRGELHAAPPRLRCEDPSIRNNQVSSTVAQRGPQRKSKEFMVAIKHCYAAGNPLRERRKQKKTNDTSVRMAQKPGFRLSLL